MRPEGWENPYISSEGETGLSLAYEAGADAMLEGLNKNGVSTDEIGHTISGNKLNVWVDKHLKGKWVFIPEE